MRSLAFGLLAVSTLFVIVDPVAAVPAFLAMTHNDTAERRIRMARLACGVTATVLLVFAAVGTWIFNVLGITMPAFQLAASVILLLIALDMLRAQRSRVQETREETAAGAAKEDIAVTPLAVPMLAGPGAISTAILLHNEAKGWIEQLVLYAAIVLVAAVSYVVLNLAARGASWLSPIATRIAERVMGLLLAAVAFQFMLNALRAVMTQFGR
jgi:multiple antibiotic resistance protein